MPWLKAHTSCVSFLPGMQRSSNFCYSFIAGLLCLSSKLLNSCVLNQPVPQEKSNHLLCIFLCFGSSCLQAHMKCCVNLVKLFLFIDIPISLVFLATSFVLFLRSSKTRMSLLYQPNLWAEFRAAQQMWLQFTTFTEGLGLSFVVGLCSLAAAVSAVCSCAVRQSCWPVWPKHNHEVWVFLLDEWDCLFDWIGKRKMGMFVWGGMERIQLHLSVPACIWMSLGYPYNPTQRAASPCVSVTAASVFHCLRCKLENSSTLMAVGFASQCHIISLWDEPGLLQEWARLTLRSFNFLAFELFSFYFVVVACLLFFFSLSF